jgi:hypothetical protein
MNEKLLIKPDPMNTAELNKKRGSFGFSRNDAEFVTATPFDKTEQMRAAAFEQQFQPSLRNNGGSASASINDKTNVLNVSDVESEAASCQNNNNEQNSFFFNRNQNQLNVKQQQQHQTNASASSGAGPGSKSVKFSSDQQQQQVNRVAEVNQSAVLRKNINMLVASGQKKRAEDDQLNAEFKTCLHEWSKEIGDKWVAMNDARSQRNFAIMSQKLQVIANELNEVSAMENELQVITDHVAELYNDMLD